ncbi:MAG TPA: TIGR00730 family Rossman fold protein [Alphaproteobacteria bacterium]|nr:TIGR00730 family Rossman fold protein [Alphaproteobacteria bacterium]
MKLPESVCVYCGSESGKSVVHCEAAKRLGRILAENDIGLVYGGGSIGLMGALASEMLEAGGSVVGIIPKQLQSLEVALTTVSELVVVDTMHERKKQMFKRSDAFVTLSGGLGTLDETFEVITWRLLGIHDKPIVIVNSDGYWSHFIDLVEKVIREGFAHASSRDLFAVVESVDEVLPAISTLPPARSAAAGGML